MINIKGLDRFRELFENYDNNYVMIGGTACGIIFDEIGETFRSTKDLDIVLIVENLNEEFGKELWEYIKEAGYIIEAGQDKRCFYRFKMPKEYSKPDYPDMIELFSRNNNIFLPEDVHIVPIHISEEISSLSAILLNDDYYDFLVNGKRVVGGISVLDEKYLIPFKAKAWCELIDRKTNGEQGHSKNIKKHCKDIYNLVSLLPRDMHVELSGMVKRDMQRFVDDLLDSEFIPGSVDAKKLHTVLKGIYL